MLHTNIHCQRSPGRKRCPGVIRASFDSNALAIYWYCPICEDNGYIRGWENTLWDRRDPDFK
jgi:hypothetical protein